MGNDEGLYPVGERGLVGLFESDGKRAVIGDGWGSGERRGEEGGIGLDAEREAVCARHISVAAVEPGVVITALEGVVELPEYCERNEALLPAAPFLLVRVTPSEGGVGCRGEENAVSLKMYEVEVPEQETMGVRTDGLG